MTKDELITYLREQQFNIVESIKAIEVPIGYNHKEVNNVNYCMMMLKNHHGFIIQQVIEEAYAKEEASI